MMRPKDGMPDVVRYWVLWAYYVVAGGGLVMTGLLLFQGAWSGLPFVLLPLLVLLLHMHGLRQGWTVSWYLQLVLSSLAVIMGLLYVAGKYFNTGPFWGLVNNVRPGRALLSLLHLYVLWQWVTPQTKAFFNLGPGRPLNTDTAVEPISRAY